MSNGLSRRPYMRVPGISVIGTFVCHIYGALFGVQLNDALVTPMIHDIVRADVAA